MVNTRGLAFLNLSTSFLFGYFFVLFSRIFDPNLRSTWKICRDFAVMVHSRRGCGLVGNGTLLYFQEEKTYMNEWKVTRPIYTTIDYMYRISNKLKELTNKLFQIADCSTTPTKPSTRHSALIIWPMLLGPGAVRWPNRGSMCPAQTQQVQQRPASVQMSTVITKFIRCLRPVPWRLPKVNQVEIFLPDLTREEIESSPKKIAYLYGSGSDIKIVRVRDKARAGWPNVTDDRLFS